MVDRRDALQQTGKNNIVFVILIIINKIIFFQFSSFWDFLSSPFAPQAFAQRFGRDSPVQSSRRLSLVDCGETAAAGV